MSNYQGDLDMQIFFTTFNQMLILFLFIITGYILINTNRFSKNLAAMLARLENYVFIPSLILNTFIDKCTINNLTPHVLTLVIATTVLFITIGISIPISRSISSNPFEQSLFKYSLITPNYSFMGNAIALGIFGEAFLFDYIIYTIPLSIFTYTIGTNWLKGNNNSIKATELVNPIFASIILGILIGLTQLPLPPFITSTLQSFSSCMSPIAMLLTGMIIGNYNIKKLISNKKVVIISLLRLVAIPLVFLFIFKLSGINERITRLAICCLSMPLGLNTIIIPAAYDKDTSLGASMTLISSTISLITIPIIFLLINFY